jgi:hypothetical protein
LTSAAAPDDTRHRPQSRFLFSTGHAVRVSVHRRDVKNRAALANPETLGLHPDFAELRARRER